MNVTCKIAGKVVDAVIIKSNGGLWRCRRQLLVYWAQIIIKELRVMLRSGEMTLEELKYEEFSTPIMTGENDKSSEKYLLKSLRRNTNKLN